MKHKCACEKCGSARLAIIHDTSIFGMIIMDRNYLVCMQCGYQVQLEKDYEVETKRKNGSEMSDVKQAIKEARTPSELINKVK